MKKFIKWFSIVLAGLLVLSAAFMAFFVVLPLSRSIRNLEAKKNEPSSAVTQTVPADNVVTTVPQPATTEAASEPASAAPQEVTTSAPVTTEYDIYRTGHFYVKGTVTDKDGETNPMEIAVTDDSIFMLTAASGVQLGVMIGGGKTYLVSPQNKMYIELSSVVMSMLGLDTKTLSAPENFNFSDMRPLSEAETVKATELNGEKCLDYIFAPVQGKTSHVFISGTRLLQTEMYSEDGSLYNRMVFDLVSADVPADRVAPPTYYTKAGLLKFMTTVTSEASG